MREIHYDEYNHKEEYNERVTRWEYGVDSFELLPFEVNEIVCTEIAGIKGYAGGFDLVKCERLTLTYSKILSYLKDKKTQLTTQPKQMETALENSLTWQGTPLEFTELVKALFESNKLNPELKQNEIFKRLKHFFNIDDFNENDKLKDIRRRTNTTTPLINILETSLNNWIKNKD